MEVWNDEAPNAHTTVDEYTDDTEYFQGDYTDTEQERNEAPPEETPDIISIPDATVVYDESGDVYSDTGDYLGNVYVNPDMLVEATDTAVVDVTTDPGAVVEMGGDTTAYNGQDLEIDEFGDMYDSNGNYIGNVADTSVDEQGNIFDKDGNFLGTTSPANQNAASSSAGASSTGTSRPSGGAGASGGGPSGSGGGSGGGASGGGSLAAKPAASSATTPTSTANRTLVQQLKSGNNLIKIYSDGTRETITNYYSSPTSTPVSPVRPAATTTNRATGVSGGTTTTNPRPPGNPSITGTPTSAADFFSSLFGNVNQGMTGPGSGAVSSTGRNPGTQLTTGGQARVSGGRTAGSTAPARNTNSMIAGSRAGSQGNSNVNQAGDVIANASSGLGGMGGLALLGIGAVALYAFAS